MSVAGPGRYESIGAGYARRRQTEPRIAAQIEAALGDAGIVLNVGAGAGSYEPVDREVVALEPSGTMIRQRRGESAPVVRGAAECLPFRDRSFDAVMGVLTLHHWVDWRAGIAEMRRVAPRRVLLAYDPALSMEFWLLTEYFPVLRELEVDRPAIGDVAEAMERTAWRRLRCRTTASMGSWGRTGDGRRRTSTRRFARQIRRSG